MVVDYEICNSIFKDNTILTNFNLTDEYNNLCNRLIYEKDIQINHYSSRPFQIRIRIKDQFTILIFNNGKIRLMGKHINKNKAEDILNRSLNLVHVSDTIKFKLTDHINIYNHINKVGIIYEPEIFPSCNINLWPNIHVNVFHTGYVTILGKNSIKLVSIIFDKLINLFEIKHYM